MSRTIRTLRTRRRLLQAAAAALTWGALAPLHARAASPTPAPWRELWLTVDGRRSFARVFDHAAPEGPPLVLVHGMALSGRYMLPTAGLFSTTHRVYVPDLPGFGDSDKPAHVLDVPALADALAGWMEAAGVVRADLLGNSFGCQIIADLAARHPERVRRTVLQGPTTPPDERSWFWQFVRWRQNAPNNPPEMEHIADGDYEKTGLVRALRTFQVSLDDRVEDKLPRVQAPSLVVRGSEDPICSQEWAEEVARRLPRGRLSVIPDVAHTLVYTAAPQLVEVSRPFLLESEPPAEGAA